MTTSMWCSMRRTARPSSRRSRPISSVSVSVSRGFMPAVGSSSRRRLRLGGERPRDLEPRADRRRRDSWPSPRPCRRDRRRRGDRRPGRAPALLGHHTRGGRKTAPATEAWSRQCSPTSTLSSTLMFWKSRIDWKVRAIPRPTMAWGRRPTRLAPSSRISPWSGREQPRDEVEEGRLARPVRADEADDAARRDHQLHVAHRHEAPEAPRQTAHLEDGRPAGGRRPGSDRFPQPGRAAPRRGDGAERPPARAPPRLVDIRRGRTDAATHQPSGLDQHDDHQPETEEEPAPQREIDGGERRRCRASDRPSG